MSGPRKEALVLAVYPFSRGLAFTVFESPLSPLDWGVKDIRGAHRNLLSLDATKRLMESHQPDVVVLHDFSCIHSRRGKRVQRLQKMIENHATAQGAEVHIYSRRQIRECFRGVGAVTRYEIAQAIVSQVHALGHRLPPVRKLWQSEPARMGIFDAASLVMTFYCRGSAEAEP